MRQNYNETLQKKKLMKDLTQTRKWEVNLNELKKKKKLIS